MDSGSEAEPLSIEPIPPFMQELIRDGGLMRHIALKKRHAQGRK
jgi:3-isopropylmalate/(R)-2-methylmalate dehydratase small subunit